MFVQKMSPSFYLDEITDNYPHANVEYVISFLRNERNFDINITLEVL